MTYDLMSLESILEIASYRKENGCSKGDAWMIGQLNKHRVDSVYLKGVLNDHHDAAAVYAAVYAAAAAAYDAARQKAFTHQSEKLLELLAEV